MNGVTNQSARAGAADSSTQAAAAAIQILCSRIASPLLAGSSDPAYRFPGCGRPRYGNTARYGTSLPSTPSPSCALIPLLNPGVSGVAPAIARIAMSVTSSPTRRPLGKPAVSPPRTPKRLGFGDGGIATLSRSISDGVTPGG